MDEEKDVENEQSLLDDHDDWISDLFGRPAKLTTPEVRVEIRTPIHGGVCKGHYSIWKGTSGR